MAECIFRGDKVIADHTAPYIIAEVNSSHGGNIEVAKQLVDAAVASGADCVKFQSWNKKSLYSKTYYDQNRFVGRFVEKFSLSAEQLEEMADYCQKQNIDFASTPYSEDEVDFLVDKTSAPFIKISSMELNNPRYLQYIGNKGIPVVLSTGMGEMQEIKSAVSILARAGIQQLALLHCVSVYPTTVDMLNLNNIYELQETFPQYPIGFSDHTIGTVAGIAAVALGAGILEKHLTLNREQIGMDNKMASEPAEFTAYVLACHNAYIAMGSRARVISTVEYQQRAKMRRSLTAARRLPQGTILKEDDLCAKRPGTGIAPDQMMTVLGKQVIVDIEADTIIDLNNLAK